MDNKLRLTRLIGITRTLHFKTQIV